AVNTRAPARFWWTRARASSLPNPAEAPVIKMTRWSLDASAPASDAMGSISAQWVSLGLFEVERCVALRLLEPVVGRTGSPPWNERILNPELVTDARNDQIDQVATRPGPVAPAGHGRQYDRAGARHAHHVFEMDQAERCFARHKNQLAPFLQMDVGGPGNQVGGGSGGDGAQGAHATGNDDHTAGWK